MTDPALLERLLRNLLDNALKHGGHGPIGIGMSQDQQLVISVTDFGPGIPASEREHIFEEFYRLPRSQHAQGLGLGLSIVRRIADLLGYRLALDYADPQQRLGTQFRLEIPLSRLLATGSPCNEVVSAPEATIDLKGLRVLVIDDNDDIVQATVLLLQQWGCQARGTSGLAEFLQNPAAQGFEPDVALIDNDHSTDNDALTVAGAVSTHWPDAGILLVTGEADPAVLSGLRQGGYPLLEKPVDPKELREVLEMFHQLN
jgi:CheY-like chemotaxis protein